MKRTLTGLALLLLCCAAALSAVAQNSVIPPAPFVVKGAATAAHLWVLKSDGSVVEYDWPGGTHRVLAEAGIIDMRRHDGRLHGLRKHSENHYRVMDLSSGDALSPEFTTRWRPALLAGTAPPAVITQGSLFRLQNGAWQQQDFAEQLRGWPGTNVLSEPGDTVYVGHNHGEWGGGLQGIDVATGRVFEVTGLERDLDPVTGVVRDPAHPGCVVASVGLMHMIARGKIIRVCGTEAEVVFQGAVFTAPDPRAKGLPHMWPFFDVAATDEIWMAISFGALFGSTGKGVVQMEIPEPEPWQDLNLAPAGPKLLVLYTDVNRRHSLSGATPLLVPVTD